MGFAYDANGRQVKATKPNTPDAHTIYDALGNRATTKINDVWQYMIYDAFGQLVAEYGIQPEGLGGVKYVQQDHQGSVRTVTNANGFVVSRTDHQAFGEEIPLGTGLRNIDQGYSVEKATRQGYGLTEDDSATGLNHTWFRKNENQAGRWTSPDPYKGSMSLSDPQSFNRYAYVGNDPVNYVDPSGLQTCYIDGMLADCGSAFGLVRSGTGVFGPLNTTRWDPSANNGEGEWQYFRAYANGARWVNMQGYSVGISVRMSYGIMEWYGGGAYYSNVPGLSRFDYYNYQPPSEPYKPPHPPRTQEPGPDPPPTPGQDEET